MLSPAEYVGLLASVFVFAISIPQLVKIVKSKSIEGVSVWTWSLILLTYASWLGYAPRLHSVAVGVNNFLAALITSVLLGYIFQVKKMSKMNSVLIVLAIIAAGFVFGYYTPIDILDVVLVVFALIRLPQLIDSYKSWKSRTVTQVSLTTWILSTAGSAFWVVYGVAMMEPILIITPGVSLLLAVGITLFEFYNLKNRGVDWKTLIPGRVKKL